MDQARPGALPMATGFSAAPQERAPAGDAAGKRRVLPISPDGRLQDLIETTKVGIGAKVEHPIRVINQPFGVNRSGCAGWPRTVAMST
jgi:hypothetical protein